MNEIIGYSQNVLYITIAIGIALSIAKPKILAYLSIIYFSARNQLEAIFTRTSLFGPYLNLDDAVIVCLIIAFFVNGIKTGFRKAIIPKYTIVIIITIFIGLVIVYLKYDITYEVLRETRGAFNFPIIIILFANFIENEEDARKLLLLSISGSILASLQYFYYIYTSRGEIVIDNYGQLRLIQYISICPYLIAFSMLIDFDKIDIKLKTLIWIALPLSILNLLFSQTRSINIAVAISFLFLSIILYKGKNILSSKLLFISFVLLISFIIFNQFFSWIDFNEILYGRMSSLTEQKDKDYTTYARLLAVKYELSEFLNSSLVFGNGIGYTNFSPLAYDEEIGWGHIGPVAYLSRLGLVGFFLYYFYIPYFNFKMSNSLFRKYKTGYIHYFSVFTLCIILLDWISFHMSASYLSPGVINSAIYLGALYRINYENSKIKG